MSERAFWAVIVCALLASVLAAHVIQAYRDANKPTPTQVTP